MTCKLKIKIKGFVSKGYIMYTKIMCILYISKGNIVSKGYYVSKRKTPNENVNYMVQSDLNVIECHCVIVSFGYKVKAFSFCRSSKINQMA